MKIERRRPGIPASYEVARDEAGMLEWRDVTASLRSSLIYWVATVTPPGAPHLIPIWGAWVQDAAYIEGGDDTRWARNLTQGDGQVHLAVDHGGMQVMVRGAAAPVSVGGAIQTVIADEYDAKYPYRPSGTDYWRITPEQILAWRTDTIDSFATTPTEFVILR